MTTWAWIDTSSGGDRFVGHDQLRVQRERAGDADALALTAGELVRVAVVVLGVETDHRQQPLHLLLHAALGLDALELEGALMIVPMVWRGFSDE